MNHSLVSSLTDRKGTACLSSTPNNNTRTQTTNFGHSGRPGGEGLRVSPSLLFRIICFVLWDFARIDVLYVLSCCTLARMSPCCALHAVADKKKSRRIARRLLMEQLI